MSKSAVSGRKIGAKRSIFSRESKMKQYSQGWGIYLPLGVKTWEEDETERKSPLRMDVPEQSSESTILLVDRYDRALLVTEPRKVGFRK